MDSNEELRSKRNPTVKKSDQPTHVREVAIAFIETSGLTFGKYILVSKLGSGGMAEVFKARIARNPSTTLAIKRILPQFSKNKDLISMLVNEAGLSLSLSHPNIVPIHDFGVIDSQYFLAMEYIHGKDLKSIMIRLKNRKGEFPMPLGIHIMAEVLQGLDYAHHKRDNYDQPLQIVHRDISPQNVMISFKGQVKILDFGIAKAASKTESTKSGVLKGKFCYMSPEQAMAKEVDPRTDIFAAGIVLWELLTLESCFQGETDVELLENVREAKILPPHEVNKKIPKELSEILMKALQKKINKRYETAGEFAEALAKYQNDRFGPISEEDVSAFLRSMYSVSLKEASPSPDPKAETLNGDSTAEPLSKSAISLSPSQISQRAPWVRSKMPGLETTLYILGTLISVLVFFWFFPPGKIFRSFDAFSIRTAEKIHTWVYRLPLSSQTEIKIQLPPLPEPLYTLQISPRAKLQMDDLSFEIFERIRNDVSDLSFRPHPSHAKAIRQRPGSWALEQSGYQIVYKVNDMPRTVTIDKIQRLRVKKKSRR